MRKFVLYEVGFLNKPNKIPVPLLVHCERVNFMNYEKILASGLKRGRKPLPAEEKQRRQALQKIKQEARRRATIVLQHKYAEEFARMIEEEMTALTDGAEG